MVCDLLISLQELGILIVDWKRCWSSWLLQTVPRVFNGEKLMPVY